VNKTKKKRKKKDKGFRMKGRRKKMDHSVFCNHDNKAKNNKKMMMKMIKVNMKEKGKKIRNKKW
jgi:hypothetical protein